MEFYAKWIEFMGEHDIDPDRTGHLQNFENSFWFRLVRVGQNSKMVCPRSRALGLLDRFSLPEMDSL
jgi:hypothetical protein